MRYCVKINPVDLFDIPLFLSFLEEKLAIGLEAVKINRFYTIFKKTASASGSYVVSLKDCEQREKHTQEKNLCYGCHGLVICRSTDRYQCNAVKCVEGMSYADLIKAGIKKVVWKTLVLATIGFLFYLLFAKATMFNHYTWQKALHAAFSSKSPFQNWILLVLLLTFSLSLFSDILVLYTDVWQRKQVLETLRKEIPYTTPRSMKRLIYLKNALAALCYAISLGNILLVLIFLLL